MPDKWARIWAERVGEVPLEMLTVTDEEQEQVLYDGRADLCFVRLPVDTGRLHAIPLYEDVPVVVAAKGHFVEAADAVTLADLDDEHHHAVPPLSVREAVETVAAGVGVVVIPLSLARLHHRKDVVHRPVVDAPRSQVALAWPRPPADAPEDPRLETFIGIVRGRRPSSSRGPQPSAASGARPPVARGDSRSGRNRGQPAGPRRDGRGRRRR
jgi:DNA-binding transcriptional LysR family regulator